MARAFDELAANGEAEQLSHAEWLGLLIDREWSSRYDRKLAARLRFAKLRHQAAPEDVDYRSERDLDRALFLTAGPASTLRVGQSKVRTLGRVHPAPGRGFRA
jgi:DNA replication protein DnaC